ncbi:MAG: type II toxin-antitoxin system VapC family toxin [Candidatus Limnocylindria bacterium]
MLFDTSVLISHLRGDRRATDLLVSVPTLERVASVLARVEIEGGMRSGERVSVAGLLDGMRLVAVTDAIARRAGEHLRRYRRSHSGIDLVDYVIAATAEAYDVPLLTLNVRHFPMFKDLQPAFG